MINLIPVQVSLFLSFIVGIWAVYGVQQSISDSWYALGRRSPLFTLWMIAVGISVICMVAYFDNVLYFLSGACLCFVGVAAEFKQRMTGVVHSVGAIGGIFLALAGIAYDGVWESSAIFIGGAALLRYLNISNKTWWIETWAFICIIGGFIQLT